MTNSEAPPSQGLVAGKYQLVRRIGRGGMGSVWEARHVTLGTSSAIKFIEAEYADSQEARSRFDKEAKAAATIQSKHAIQIYDHGVTDDGKPYIVMELLRGEPLDKRIERLGRLTLQDTATILQQVCRGLARAHERGIVHRDLKPENIFIVRNLDDDEEVAKVLDFGIAKMSNVPGSSGLTSSTKTGAVLGTPFYMSPEQARGLRNVDHRTDVWSLGVIAFKCLTGELPFDGESIGDLLVKICTAPVPVPSHVMPTLSPNFDAWFMRALERDPERRFANVTELSEALCFAAGIATRSQRGAPIPPMVGAAPGAPHGYGASTPSPYGRTPAHASGTPPPGAMTNAPFTASRAHISSGKGKLLIGGLVAGVLAIAATVGVLFLLKGTAATQHGAANGVVASPPPASAVALPAAPEATADDRSETDAPEKPAATPAAAETHAAGTSAAPATTKPAKAPAPPKTPKAPSAPVVPTSPATAASPPPLPAVTAKRPRDRNDPGY